MAKKHIPAALPFEDDIALPPPLDKPMETFNLDYSGTLEDKEIAAMLYELIQRQNALIEVVKSVLTKGLK